MGRKNRSRRVKAKRGFLVYDFIYTRDRHPHHRELQEPAANGEELHNGIKHVRPGNGFEPNFTMFRKIDVNGESGHPLYAYLKAYCPPTRQIFADPDYLFYSPLRNNDVRWNWEKFLVTKNGKPYMRYDQSTTIDDIKNDITFLLLQDD